MIPKKITARTITKVGHADLFALHTKVHAASKTELTDKEIALHKVLADEFKKRNILHHAWDKLDHVYTNS